MYIRGWEIKTNYSLNILLDELYRELFADKYTRKDFTTNLFYKSKWLNDCSI